MNRVVDETNVVIVGAGPAGLTAAYELGRRGHAALVLEWTRRVLSPDYADYLQSLPVTVTPEEPSFTLVHASPRDPMWEYLLDLFDAAEGCLIEIDGFACLP